jgi:hypothetical protein
MLRGIAQRFFGVWSIGNYQIVIQCIFHTVLHNWRLSLFLQTIFGVQSVINPTSFSMPSGVWRLWITFSISLHKFAPAVILLIGSAAADSSVTSNSVPIRRKKQAVMCHSLQCFRPFLFNHRKWTVLMLSFLECCLRAPLFFFQCESS